IRVGNGQNETVNQRDHGESFTPFVDLVELVGNHGLIGAAAIKHVQVIVLMARNSLAPHQQSYDGEGQNDPGIQERKQTDIHKIISRFRSWLKFAAWGGRSSPYPQHPSRVYRKFSRWLPRWHPQPKANRHPVRTGPAGGSRSSRREPPRRILSRPCGEWLRCIARYRRSGQTGWLGPLGERGGTGRNWRVVPGRTDPLRYVRCKRRRSGCGPEPRVPLVSDPYLNLLSPEPRAMHAEVQAGGKPNYGVLQRFGPQCR